MHILPTLTESSLFPLQSPFSSISCIPYFEILELVGLNPYMPHQLAGNLIDPAISDPIASDIHLVATTPPAPPEEPPVVLDLSQGFLD